MGKIHGISTPPDLLLCLSSSKNSSLWKKGLEIAGTQGFNILKSSLYGYAIHV